MKINTQVCEIWMGHAPAPAPLASSDEPAIKYKFSVLEFFGLLASFDTFLDS